MPPDRTISQTARSGRKKGKKRLTLLVCCNATGTEKFSVLLIENAKKQQCFNKKSGAELGFDYTCHKRAWMTIVIFIDWLKRLDAFTARTPVRKILLLLDSFSGHGSPGCFPELFSAELKLLPANATLRLQPLDAGIASSLKGRYRILHYKRILDGIDSEHDIYSIDQLTAMRFVHSVWLVTPVDITVNCWRVCDLFGSATRPSDSGEALVALDTAAEQFALFNLPSYEWQLSISSLSKADDDEFLEQLDESSLAQILVQELKVNLTKNTKCPEDGTCVRGPFTLQEQIKTVRTSLLITECQRTLNLQLVQHLRVLLHDLRRQAV